MALRLKAEYLNGALRPLEPLDLREGTVVTLSIEEENHIEARVHSALEIADRLRQSAPPETWDNMPADSAKNVDHYLYGHPKEDT